MNDTYTELRKAIARLPLITETDRMHFQASCEPATIRALLEERDRLAKAETAMGEAVRSVKLPEMKWAEVMLGSKTAVLNYYTRDDLLNFARTIVCALDGPGQFDPEERIRTWREGLNTYRYCNKCGYAGPQKLHNRPDDSGECDYFSTVGVQR